MGETLPLPNRSDDPQGSTSGVERSLLYHGAQPVRRTALEALADAGQQSLDALATDVAARLGDDSTTTVEGTAPEDVITELYHNHLQSLSDAGLVERYDESTVALAPAVDPAHVRELTRAGDGAWEALEALLADRRRERVVAVLSSVDDPMSLTGLAEAVAALERPTTDGPRASVEAVRVSLHHVDLPKLSTVGILTYDHEDQRAELDAVPDVYSAYVA